MSVDVISFCLLLSSVITVLVGIFYIISKREHNDDVPGWAMSILLLIVGLLSSWMTISNYQRSNPIVQQISVCEIKTVTGGITDFQEISWIDEESGEYCNVNVNSKYARTFVDGDQIRVTQYKLGPYFGLYWDIRNKYELILVKRIDKNVI
jgi:uncharacterized membrane protein YjdF